ncbi:MAG: phosphoribosylformylglycinamidine synthase subunit PurQ [Nitrososphaerales archaeon]
MDRGKIRICVMRVGGTNRDADVANCLEDMGVNVEILHLNDILRRRNLATYNGLVFPGGFAYGDYVRAGAIWAKRLQAFIKEDLKRFCEAGRPVIGICNGFQVLVEAGLLPGFEIFEDPPKIALASNKSGRFECRWVYVKKDANSKCAFASGMPEIARFPVAHGEGRFITQDDQVLKKLEENNQVVLRYCSADGTLASGSYPQNPNGSVHDIAGICNPAGNVFGLMPHPEDAYWGYQLPEWTTQRSFPRNGEGRAIFLSMVEYIEKTT